MKCAEFSVRRVAREIAGQAGRDEHIEAFVAHGTDTHLLVRDQEAESVSTASGGGVGIRVLRRNRIGFAHTNAFDRTSLSSVLAQARENTRYSAPSRFATFAAPDGIPAASINLWCDQLIDLPFTEKLTLARDLEQRLKAFPAVSHIKSVAWGDSMSESAVASSTGVQSYSRRTSCFLSAYVIGKAADGRVATSTAYTQGRGPADLGVAKAADEAVRSLPTGCASRLDPQRLPAILTPRATAVFLPVIAGILNRAADYPHHPYGTAPVGTAIASEALNLIDDPSDPTAFGVARYDAEGLATRPNTLIEQGRIAGRLHDAAGGSRVGTLSNGSAFRGGYKSLPRAEARALSIVPGTLAPEDAAAQLDHGFLVEEVVALKAGEDRATGTFSAAVRGRMIQHGEPTAWVPHTVIALTIPSLLMGIVSIGTDSVPLPGRAKGTTLLLSELSLGGR
ncbi:TldD/PmbA family protein [Streptomyces luteogriseus]|uniref:TldD/PmbA family protein n=1 Tax=Streptomyces luteogriseus TaxID=68233 RepID=UPI0033CF9B5C